MDINVGTVGTNYLMQQRSVFLVFRVYWLFKIVKYTKMQGQTEWRHAIKNLGSNISFVMLSLQYISVLKFCVF